MKERIQICEQPGSLLDTVYICIRKGRKKPDVFDLAGHGYTVIIRWMVLNICESMAVTYGSFIVHN